MIKLVIIKNLNNLKLQYPLNSLNNRSSQQFTKLKNIESYDQKSFFHLIKLIVSTHKSALSLN